MAQFSSVLRVVGWYFFHFHSYSIRTSCKQRVETLIRQNAASVLGLHSLPMSHKKDDRLKWNTLLWHSVIQIKRRVWQTELCDRIEFGGASFVQQW